MNFSKIILVYVFWVVPRSEYNCSWSRVWFLVIAIWEVLYLIRPLINKVSLETNFACNVKMNTKSKCWFYSRTFNVINPTNDGYEFVFELLTFGPELIPFHCNVLKGFVEGGTSWPVTMTFAPTAPGVRFLHNPFHIGDILSTTTLPNSCYMISDLRIPMEIYYKQT